MAKLKYNYPAREVSNGVAPISDQHRHNVSVPQSSIKVNKSAWWSFLDQGFLTRGARTVLRGFGMLNQITMVCYLSNSRRGCENWLVIWCDKKKG